jgi:glutamate/tyrosine decarboxylase-like PLP-dependent enzyme
MRSADADGTAPAPQFEWSAEEIRRVGYRVVDLVAEHLGTLRDRPVFQPVPRALAERLMSTELPQRGESVDDILDQCVADIAPYPFGNGHPRFYGWVNSPPAVLGVLVDALGAAMNPSVAGGNHGAVWVERQVLEWFKGLVALPQDSMGLLVSGASSAALTALAVARHTVCSKQGLDVRSEGLPPRASSKPPRLLIYKGGEGHGCHQKAVELLGLGSSSIRVVPHDAALRMIPDALDAMLREDSAQGHLPMAVIASAGTVNTGAVDPLGALADVCQKHRLWLHVDAAYGGPAFLTNEYRDLLAPMSRADSIAIDPHKWFYVPVDAGVVLVRDAAAMRSAFSLVPPYLRTDGNIEGVQGLPWFSEFGLEQTRPFRALKVWAALKYFGVEGYRRLIDHDIAMARHLAERIRDDAMFELWEPQGLSIVCFRCVPQGMRADATAVDALNQQILTSVQLGGEAFLSSTILQGRLYLRACVVNPRATEADVNGVFDVVRSAARRCLGR